MRLRWRKALSSIVVALCLLSVLVALLPLALVLFYVVTQGITSLNLAFFTHMPVPHGENGGGMANAILGSLMVTGLGAMGAIPIGIIAGIYAAEYRGTRLASIRSTASRQLSSASSLMGSWCCPSTATRPSPAPSRSA
jgi:phosphate transport system permease protein